MEIIKCKVKIKNMNEFSNYRKKYQNQYKTLPELMKNFVQDIGFEYEVKINKKETVKESL